MINKSIQNHFSRLLNKQTLTSTNAILIYLAFVNFIIHILFATNYGYFRDELYYIVSGTQHLSLGYVDFPPFIAYVAFFLGIIANDSLFSIHVVSAFIESLIIIVAGLIPRELGGERKAQILTAITTILTLGFMATGSLFSPDTFDQFWWVLLAYIIIRMVNRNEPQLWIYAGIVVGIGLLTKLTIFFFVLALLGSFLIIPKSRIYLRSKWLGIGSLISIIFIIPMLYWNLINGWPMVNFYLEFRGDVSGGGPLTFIFTQIATLDFLNIVICILGLLFYLRSEEGRKFKSIGLAFVFLFLFMLILNMKPYYLFPIYPIVFAGGSVVIEKSSINKVGRAKWFGSKPFMACLVLIVILLAPDVMPILPPETMIKIYGPSTSNTSSSETGILPQELGDRVGWNEMVTTMVDIYNTLQTSEKNQVCIFTGNYGEASAINFLGTGTGLPVAISGHNNYYIWGPGSCTGQVLLTIGIQLPQNQNIYANMTLMTTITCQYCINLENNITVYLLTNPVNGTLNLGSLWNSLRHYD